jgi:hypothetical protein
MYRAKELGGAIQVLYSRSFMFLAYKAPYASQDHCWLHIKATSTNHTVVTRLLYCITCPVPVHGYVSQQPRPTRQQQQPH